MLVAVTLEQTPPELETCRPGDHDRAGDITAARRGDRAAFARLHDRYAPMVHGILLAHVPFEDAEDLAQDVFMQAMRKLATLRDPEAFGPWLATMTRNFTVRFHRRRRQTGDLPTHLPADDCPDRDASAEAGAALAVIRSLPEAYRETLILRLVEGLTGPQIAACTGLSAGSVRVNLHRGMKLLRASLQPEERR